MIYFFQLAYTVSSIYKSGKKNKEDQIGLLTTDSGSTPDLGASTTQLMVIRFGLVDIGKSKGIW